MSYVQSTVSLCATVLCFKDYHSYPAALFGDEIPPSRRLEVRCNHPSPVGWSHSLDGTLPPTGDRLNTSSPKYTVDGVTLIISEINKMDEGLYRCIYEHSATSSELCVYIYGMFVCVDACCMQYPLIMLST